MAKVEGKPSKPKGSRKYAIEIRKHIRAKGQPVLEKAVKTLEELVADWSDDSRPEFTVVFKNIHLPRNYMYLSIKYDAPIADGSTHGHSAFHFVLKGTNVRRVVLGGPDEDTPYEPKTLPFQLTPTGGRGGYPAFISRKLDFRGIEKRDFFNELRRDIREQLRDIVREGAKEFNDRNH